jgi:pyruvate dehydrogenase E1 component alpha subunit
VGIPSIYRTAEEIEEWKQRDPIQIHRQRLVSGGALTDARATGIEEEVKAELLAAVEFAQGSEFPDPAEAFEGLYASPVPKGRGA